MGEKKKINIETCKREADVFRSIGKNLALNNNGVQFLKYEIGPCAVNLALSCELYFKILFAIDHENKAITGHK